MTPADAPPSTPPHGLKFHWPQRAPISLPLVGFLFFSVAAHGLAFYILQVVDPPGVVIPPPPAQVNLLTPWKISGGKVVTAPENLALLQWIDASDPAPLAGTHEIVPATLYDPPYQRSLANLRTTPKSPGEREPAAQYPPAEETMALIGAAQESAPAPPAVIVPGPTELKFSGELAGRKIDGEPPMKFTSGAEGRAPSSFMVGIGADGRVLYVFSMGMETDDKAKAIERQAADYLETVKFSRAPGGISWGIATYYWGDDSDDAGAARP